MLMVKLRSTMYIANKSSHPKTGPLDSPKRKSQNEWIACTDAKNNISQTSLCSGVACPQKVNMYKRMARTALSCISEVVISRQFMACTILVKVIAASACKTASWVPMIFSFKGTRTEKDKCNMAEDILQQNHNSQCIKQNFGIVVMRWWSLILQVQKK
ncbi:hypothetical protein Taro_046882 [Colocasia esculenta]|uniref:Uncharacterized protein n=1 Tax=Colocasia esculenta TaxID=4460 RepID=A0A843WR84_COLES|nr:hypothetical protein [Colocasia esculenta]